MKPLYILLILYALFITGLADGLEFALAAIPLIGIVLGLAVSFCINITMGAGLLLLLVQNDMFHPKFGPFGVVVGMIPGLNSLPVWIALVGAGILQKVSEEEPGAVGALAKVAASAGSFSLANPLAAAETAAAVAHAVSPNREQPQSNSNVNEGRTPLNLKSPRMNDIKPYAPKAA